MTYLNAILIVALVIGGVILAVICICYGYVLFLKIKDKIRKDKK